MFNKSIKNRNEKLYSFNTPLSYDHYFTKSISYSSLRPSSRPLFIYLFSLFIVFCLGNLRNHVALNFKTGG